MTDIKLNKQTVEKIHISFFVGSLDIGGTEKQLLKLLNSLDKKKFKIDLYIISEKGDLFKELDKEIKVYLPKFRFKSKLRHLLNFIVNYYRVKKTKPDIIHCFLPFAYLIGGFIGLLTNNQNIIMSRRSLNNYQKKFPFINIRKIESFLHKRIRLIIANANAVKRNLIKEGAPEKKIKVICNGFIKPKSAKNETHAILKNKLGIDKNCFIFLVLANLIPYKNHKLVIEAADSLIKLTKKKFKIIFLGSGKDEYQKFLRGLIRKKRIQNYFSFRDKTTHTSNFFKISDVGISSSFEEGLSNSLIEFISFGIPTIATRVGGNSEITNNKNGFLIENNNRDELVKAMKTLMLNKKLLKNKGIKSKQDSKKFLLNKMVSNHNNLYKNLMMK